jgi:hypothetical protein
MRETVNDLNAAFRELWNILESQGWREGCRDADPGNFTVWIGPRLHKALDHMRDALERESS